jgi:predicted site-specific integrase-resolvase
MKLSAYASKHGISYPTAWRWFKAGKCAGFQADTGTIIMIEPTIEANFTTHHPRTVIYARVSAAEKKDHLQEQANRVMDPCAAKGYQVADVVKEIGEGVDDTRPKLLKLLTDPTNGLIDVEHKDRLTRFGLNDIEQLLAMQDREIEVTNLAENGKEELILDLVSIVTSFYRQRRGKHKTERIIAELQNGEEGDHPSQTQPGQPKQTRKAR